MNNIVVKNLYTEYAPTRLGDFIGQERIISEMETMCKTLTFPKVMMFYGPSGTGKTSLARYIVRMLLCEDLILNNAGFYQPCMNCSGCINFKPDDKHYKKEGLLIGRLVKVGKGVCVHKYQHDAANYRDYQVLLIENSDYIFNLKDSNYESLIESIDRHSMPIIITSNLTGVLDERLLSRVSTYKFERPKLQQLEDHLKKILNAEKAAPPEILQEEFMSKSLPYICKASNLNIRMAIQTIEQCIKADIWDFDTISFLHRLPVQKKK